MNNFPTNEPIAPRLEENEGFYFSRQYKETYDVINRKKCNLQAESVYRPSDLHFFLARHSNLFSAHSP